MPSISKPTSEQIEAFLAGQDNLPFTYTSVGATASIPPQRFRVDRTRVCLGSGDEAFDAAREALQEWHQFQLSWLAVYPRQAPIREGQVVAIVARFLNVWWLNSCRIVYSFNDELPVRRFGFAYGTLPGHAGCGEERFLVEMDEDEQVWFDVLAFSRPQRLHAWIGYPLLRSLQKRFGRDASAAMRASVNEKLQRLAFSC